MVNRLAPYKDPDFIHFMRDWFEKNYANDAHVPGHVVTALELYQNYHEYTTPSWLYEYRLEFPRFLKVLRACRITDIGGRWQRLDYVTPTERQIRRTR